MKNSLPLLHSQPTSLDGFPKQDQQLLQDLLEENERIRDGNPSPFRIRSTTTPSFTIFPAIQVFYNALCEESKRLPHDNVSGQNLTREERHAINT